MAAIGEADMQDRERNVDRSEPARPVESPRRDSATIVKVVVGLILAILFIVFVAQNSKPVTVNFVFGDARVRLIWVFVACALIGGIVAFLLGRSGRRTNRRYIKELERRVAEAERRD
jgi:uncharacterized integral membrane protein